MTKVSASGNTLVVEMLGSDKVWSLRSRVEVPLTHISGICPAGGEKVRGLRLPGTYVPGLITAGTFRHEGQREFWAVHDSRQAVAIELRDENFLRLVVEVPDHAETVSTLRKAMASVGV